MNRHLDKLNLTGILLLAALCAFQWRANRALNLQTAQLRQQQTTQAATIAEHAKTIQGQAADLDFFRAQLASAKTAEKEYLAKIGETHTALGRAAAERDQFQKALTDWKAAVKARDQQITQANSNILELIQARDQAITRYNDLAQKHNDLVATLNMPPAK
jgi:chromosome segregation ATPase